MPERKPPRKPNRKPSAKSTRRLLGGAVRVIRDDLRKMSQDELGRRTGLNASTVSRYESGTAFASHEAMCKIAAALEVNLDAISYPVHTVTVVADTEDAA